MPAGKASAAHSITQQIQQLPIYSAKKALFEEFARNDCLVIVGETGSGKTTQIPQYLFEWMRSNPAASKQIAITQPRRVAAISVANRVTQEMEIYSKKEFVGYRVRFEDNTTPQTRIKYMTDGMLLREALLDPELSRYRAIIVDEAHERTISTDVLFGLLYQLKQRRDDLKIIIMSATLDAELFADFFKAKILFIEGRQYPVDVFYTPEPEEDYLDAALITILQIHLFEPAGDILVFLTGREDIEDLEKLLVRKMKMFPENTDQLLVRPLYAALPHQKQMEVFEKTPAGHRKVVLATNIAETSITMNGIRYVVDTGLSKVRAFNPRIGIDSLMVAPISKAAARQRCGRAGRESAGICYRLYTEGSYGELDENTTPEIQRCNLSSVILQMKALGIDDVLGFPFLSAPPVASIRNALETLLVLGALRPDQSLTPLGLQMAELPLEPMYAKTVIISKSFGCFEDVLSIVSMLSVESIFYFPKEKQSEVKLARQRFAAPEGDHLTMLAVYQAFMQAKDKKQFCWENFLNLRAMNKVLDVRQQLVEYSTRIQALDEMQDVEESSSSYTQNEKILRCFASAFYTQIALLHEADRRYHTLSGKETFVHPSSSLYHRKQRPSCIVYNELVLTTKYYMRDVSEVQPAWLPELAPLQFQRG